ncbi:GDP-mannose 4,6-dehydratase [Aeromicrobium fastidiosum]|uniref:GDP-mannose 4,6-dehydratase n=1 Tax=Aeromicrobium fastidiosum TaxID=52699 RepID=A0A641AT12_9ACTN|nr:GDP-mannose 4,6-dehydratase [Aeromicrobium fastidiosum]KAA1380667.1 GDP-mannose 4,6-dehydratase [Aeromicrobium fastidiosum]MBP2390277.1 GDPmannose 4,6-dehydratase [Aeromicrobium fastidiosum]
MTDRALVTGANGQDGSYLVQQLLAAGDEVVGMCHSQEGAERLRSEHPGASAIACDLSDDLGIQRVVRDVAPSRIFNLAGNTSVARSWEHPADTADVLGIGPVRIFDAAWKLSQETGDPVRVLQASSAEIFGSATQVPQDELTLRRPVTPYGAAKNFAHEMAAVYRARGMHVSSAILYNHESPSRPETFVARKITMAVCDIVRGRQDVLALGNIDVQRDWGYAPDYVDAMVSILSHDVPGDFVVATGESHTVREFVAEAFACVGVDDWQDLVEIDPRFYRPADPEQLVGDSSRLRSIGWSPTVTFQELVKIMVEAELARG